MTAETKISRYAGDEPIIIVGGSGFIGTNLAKRLSSLGATSIINVDTIEPRETIPGVHYIKCDVRNLSELKIEGKPRLIFNLSAVHTTPGHPTHEYYEVNVLGALEVTAFAERNNITKIIFTSSISVYGPGEDAKSESTIPAPESAYGWSKWLAENVHRKWLERHDDCKLVICRPAVIYGQGEGGNFTRLAKLLSKGFFIYPGRKDTIKACFYVEDLIDTLMYTDSKDEHYILYNGCYPDNYELQQIIEAFQTVAFDKAHIFILPRYVMILLAILLKPFAHLGLGIHPERIHKLLRSTNITPLWLISQGVHKSGQMSASLSDWKKRTHGSFS